MNKTIEWEFAVIRPRGHEAVFSIDAPEARGEWGIRVVLLDENNNGNHEVVYRKEYPDIDDAWHIGTLEDASIALDEVADSWQESQELEEYDDSDL